MSDDDNAGSGGADGGDAGSGAGDGGGTGAEFPAWMSSLPDAMKQNEGFKQFGEATEAYTKLDELLKADGEGFKIPGEDATDEEKGAFAQKMGRPETADGYELGKPEGWPAGVAYDENLEAAYRETAFGMGLSGDKAKGLYDWYNKMSLESHAAQAETEKVATEKAVNELEDVWKGDDFKVNTELAHRAFKQYAGEEATAFLEETVVNGTALGNHPTFLKLFAEIGKTIGDDTTNPGRGGSGGELSEEDKAKARFPATYKK